MAPELTGQDTRGRVLINPWHRPIQLVMVNATPPCTYVGLIYHIICTRLYYYWICKIQRSWQICDLFL